MKTLVTGYTFNPSQKKVTLTDYAAIQPEALLLITNLNSNVIIYNFANPAAGYSSISGNVITLEYDTSSMSSSDKLQIYYDDPAYSSATDEAVVLLRRLLKTTDSLATIDTNQRLRVAVDSWTNASTATIGRVNILDGGSQFIYSINGTAPLTNMYTVPDIWRTIELARQNYGTSIRSNLTFS